MIALTRALVRARLLVRARMPSANAEASWRGAPDVSETYGLRKSSSIKTKVDMNIVAAERICAQCGQEWSRTAPSKLNKLFVTSRVWTLFTAA